MTKIQLVNEILKIKPSFLKTQSQLFAMTLEELKIMLENLRKREMKENEIN